MADNIKDTIITYIAGAAIAKAADIPEVRQEVYEAGEQIANLIPGNAVEPAFNKLIDEFQKGLIDGGK